MVLFMLLTMLDPINGDFFEQVVREHGSKVYSIAYSTLAKYGRANREDAEDLVQETFIKVYKNSKRFNNLTREETIALLVIYTRYTVIDFLRRKQRRSGGIPIRFDEDGDEAEMEITDDNPLPDEIVIQKESIERCAACIDELPEGQRTVVILKYRYGYKDREIAALLNITESSVSSRLTRARAALRKKMGDDLNG